MPSRFRSLSEHALAALLALACAASASRAEDAGLIAGVFEPPRAAPELALRGSDGKELRLDRYRGKVVILGFGFSSCPDVCPTTLAALAGARKKLGADADRVQVVYVTVDPERDDAARLRQYLGRFDPTFVGGTGTAEQLAEVRQSYGIALGQRPGAGFSHSSFTYLIDRDGRIRALMPYGHSSDDYAHDVRLLLQSGGRAAAARE
ncbi:MAG: SCO family protein [Deltaproteobacteria bacterium]|nr:MAG: SCO family protein [Deltaproteobacteria bacterium]